MTPHTDMKARSKTAEAHHSVTASISIFVSRNVFDFPFPWGTVVLHIPRHMGKRFIVFPLFPLMGKELTVQIMHSGIVMLVG